LRSCSRRCSEQLLKM